jgi:hypothetical protein
VATLQFDLNPARAQSDSPAFQVKLDAIDVTLTAALQHEAAHTRYLSRADLGMVGAVGLAHQTATTYAGGALLTVPGARSFAWVVLSLDNVTSDVDCSIGTTIYQLADRPRIALLEAWLGGATAVAAQTIEEPS